MKLQTALLPVGLLREGGEVRAITCAMLLLVLVGSGVSVAQTNSWNSPTRGYWDDYTKWSLNARPSTNGQTLILIATNTTLEVTIDSYTADNYPNSMIVSDLVVSSLGVATDTLELSEAGTTTPLQVLDTLIVTNGGALYLGDSALSVEGGTNSGFSVDGSVFMEGNSVLDVTPLFCVGLDSNALGSITITGGQLLMSEGAIGINSAGQMIISNAQVNATNDVFVGLGGGSQGALTVSAGTYITAPLCRLLVGMETGSVGAVTVNGGSLVETNSFITMIGDYGAGQFNVLSGTAILSAVEVGGDNGSQGTLTVAGGVTMVQGLMAIGCSSGATGTVWVTGGQLVQTNTYVGPSNTISFMPTSVGQFGNGLLTVSNGTWLGGSMMAGEQSNAMGTVTLNGGTMTLYTKLVLGNCSTGGIGVVNVAGGSLYVTNAAHNAVIYLNNGELNLSGGLLQADILVMTNVCGSYMSSGGTLVLGNLVDGIPTAWKLQYGFNPLDPTLAGKDLDGTGFTVLQDYLAGLDPTNSASVFRITSIQPSGNGMAITWSVVTGKTYAVQVTTNSPSSGYTNLVTMAVPASPMITQTNYVDAGAATNSGPRFYRVKLVTSP